MGLEVKKAINHVRPGPFKPAGLTDMLAASSKRALSSTSAVTDFAFLGRFAQRLNNGRVLRGAVQASA